MNESTGIEWDEEKNQRLLDERGIGFHDALEAIASGRILADEAHPNPSRYGHQRILVVEIGGYACVVPYVRTGHPKPRDTHLETSCLASSASDPAVE